MNALNKREAGLERKEEALTGRQQHIEQMERKAEELVTRSDKRNLKGYHH